MRNIYDTYDETTSISDIIPFSVWSDIPLLDRGHKETGGVSFAGETLDNFLAETEQSESGSFLCFIESMIMCDVAVEYNGVMYPSEDDIILIGG